MTKTTMNISYDVCKDPNEKQVGNHSEKLSIINEELSRELIKPINTLFQVSTSSALVSGAYDGGMTVRNILKHGGFGLGTFSNLDGEMVALDGKVFQVRGTGIVTKANDDIKLPFAVVTHFVPGKSKTLRGVYGLEELELMCDGLRHSDNIFYAIKIEGEFDKVKTRAVNPQEKGSRLIDAAKKQSEFCFNKIKGTLVGIWSPVFSGAFSIPGYHFHFISDDRQHGGHLLGCKSNSFLKLTIKALSNFHLCLPESENYLTAELTNDISQELAYAETVQPENNHEKY